MQIKSSSSNVIYTTTAAAFYCVFLENEKRLRGYVLLSQEVAPQVPSALKSLTSVFGMGTGVSSLL